MVRLDDLRALALYPPVDLAGEVRWATVDAPARAQTARRRDQLAALDVGLPP